MQVSERNLLWFCIESDFFKTARIYADAIF